MTRSRMLSMRGVGTVLKREVTLKSRIQSSVRRLTLNQFCRLVGEKVFIILPPKGNRKATIHQHLQVGVGGHLTFRDRLNEGR
jgi:hypothetical protein